MSTTKREVQGDSPVGTAVWDIGQTLTRHESIGPTVCALVAELRRTAGQEATERMRQLIASKVTCTCGIGVSELERTSV